MSNFELLSKNLTSTLLSLIESQKLCKLLKYTSSDPLSEDDIEDTTELINNQIFPYPKFPSITTNAGCFVNVIFDDFVLGDTNAVKEGLIIFNIIIHNTLWKTDYGALRPFMILSEIDKIFNDKRVFGVKKLQFNRGRYIIFNENFNGYQVSYRIANGN